MVLAVVLTPPLLDFSGFHGHGVLNFLLTAPFLVFQ